MTFLLDAGWLLTRTLSVGGLLIALSGVAVFGWYFVRINAAAARGEGGEIPAASWRGPGAKRGLTILAGGALVILVSIILGAVLPGRY